MTTSRRLPEVTCLDCGFLAFGQREASFGEREMIASKGVNAKMPVLDNLHCFRSLWVGFDTDYCGQPDVPKLEEANQRRRCSGFRQHKAGFSPEEHKQIESKSEERRIQFAYNAVSLLFGSILTFLVLWAGKHTGLTR